MNFPEKSFLPFCVIKLSSFVQTERPTHPHNFLHILSYRDIGRTISIPEGNCVIKLSSFVQTERPTHPHNFLHIFSYRDVGRTISIPEGNCVIKLSSFVQTERPTHPHNFLHIFSYRDMDSTISVPEGTHPGVDDGECRQKSLHMTVSFMSQTFLLKALPDMTSNF